ALSASLLGCGRQAPKPMTPGNKIAPNGTRSPNTTTTPQPNMERVMADRFSNLANQVSGVKGSTVVVNKNATGNTYTVMVGIELNADIKGSASEKVKKQVADRIKSNDTKVNKVLVTTDPDLITRLKDIASGVIKGKPVSSFAKEISELAKRIAPTMK
ncbi:MAG: YhcN/YlaJ family sporulation lipoprotein, partial [Methylocystaceae bacterium]